MEGEDKRFDTRRTSQSMISVPRNFAEYRIKESGETGREWINALPELFDKLCAKWRIVPDGDPMHGHLALVLPVRRDNEPLVVKISWMDDSNRCESRALEAWNGNGAVRLLAADPAGGAMLLERLDSRRNLSTIPFHEAITVSGRLLRRLAMPAPHGLPTASGVLTTLANQLTHRRESYGGAIPKPWIQRARELAIHLARSNTNLLVNYDLHFENVLAGQREPWLAVDPKVVAGNVEYGIAQLLWTSVDAIIAGQGFDYCFDLLADAAEIDITLARSCTIVRTLDYWLWALSVGFTVDPHRCEILMNWLMARRED